MSEAMIAKRSLILVALGAANLAAAQNYVVTSAPAPYQPLVGGTNIKSMFSSTDDAQVIMPIGFTFPYFGQNYTSVGINTNGFITFQTSVCSPPGFQSCLGGTSMPNATRTPHQVIAAWWEDMSVSAAATQVNYLSTPTQLDVEWRDLNRLGGSFTVTMRITLFASGQIQVHYGNRSGSGGAGVMGFEGDGQPANGASFNVPPNNLPCSTSSAACTMSNFPIDTVYTIGQPMGPDLFVQSVALNSVMNSGGMMNISITPTFRNFGLMAANGFTWDAWLSTDRTWQMTDLPIGATTMPINCAPSTTVQDTLMAQIPQPPNGNYYVIVRADAPNNNVAEGMFGELNNIGSTSNYFVSGLDLVATSISGPTMSGPGNMVTINVNWFNQGTDAAGNVDFGIYLSGNTTWDASDFLLYQGTKNVSGGQTIMEGVTFTVPNNVPGGMFYYILRLNIGMPPVVEAPGNNTAVSGSQVTVRQSDLVIKGVEFVDVTTGTPTTTALFGSPGRMRVTAANEGGADARNFRVGVVVSQDSNLSLLQDTIVIESPVTLIAQGTTQVLDVMFQLPENDRANRPFTTGNYFFFGLLDSSGQITELSETNNNMMVMNPVVTRAPAADLTVTRFDAPSAVGVGEIAPVYRVFKNVGNRDASDVKYRYYASANAQVTVDDTPCRILTGGNARDFDAISMPAGAIVAGTEMIEIPATLTPGTYYLGAVLDTDQAVTELDESNNGLGSLPVTVAPSALRITTTSLPDAVIDRPYMFQLSAAGEVPGQATTWDVDEAQGNLPNGLTLSTGGLLSGMPTSESVVGVTFTVTNNNVTAVKRLALRVLPTTTQVEITTPSLPPVVNSTLIMYETFLGAAGGVKPYRWSQVAVAGEVLPRGINLTPDGRLYGNPQTGIMEKPYPITLEVRDSLGTASRRTFNLRVVAPGAIIFENLNLPEGLVGDAYLHDISVRNFDMSPLAKPLTYRIVSGQLPDGITEVREGDVLLLQGKPQIAGLFAFTIEVEDARGRVDSADFLLRVYPSGLKISVNNLPERLVPGDPVDFTFVVNGASDVTFELFSGALPPGATFNADGHVTGMVDPTATQGSYNFVVQAKDSVGATGLGAFSLNVKRDPPRQGCKCSAIDAGLMWVALLAVARKRRRS